MIIIHPLKIAFQGVPKVGTTSLFTWFHTLLFNRDYEPQNDKWIHGFFQSQQNDIIEHCEINEFKKADGYLTFCLTRDPVKRFLSAYSNRVLFHNELDLIQPLGKRAIKEGLLARPQLDFLIDHLDEYTGAKGSIHHHMRPMLDFLGQDLSVYDHIFDINKMSVLQDTLIQHWKNLNLSLDYRNIPDIPRKQTGGKKLGLHSLSPRHFDILINYYREDYTLFPTVDREIVRLEWERARASISEPDPSQMTGKLTVKKYHVDDVDLQWLPEISLVPDKTNGEIMSFMGAVLLSSKAKDEYRLIFSDARGQGFLKWKLPSPKLSEKYPDNHNAAYARYKATGLHVGVGTPVSIFLENAAGRWDLLTRISLFQKS